MFSQDEYGGRFCPSMVIDCLIAEATALLINYTWWAASYPLIQWCIYARIVALESGLAIQFVIVRSSIPSPTSILSASTSFQTLNIPPKWCSYARIGAPQSPLRPRFAAVLFHSRLGTALPIWLCSSWIAAPLDRCTSTPLALLGPALLPSVTFPAPPSTSALPLPTLHSTSGTLPSLVAYFFFLRLHHIAFHTPF
jgi:hypothetical protein